MQRLRASGTSIVSSISAARLKRKAVNSWTAVQDTFYSTKDVFERHKVVFTVGTSVASVATAWIGYTLRHYHDIRVDRRLESIEEAMRTRRQLEHSELTKAVNVGKISVPACFATAGTCLIIGYCLGWRGGKQYANKQFRREQMKLLGEIKPRWPLLMRVITTDGFILSMQRIPSRRTNSANGPPVLLQHGLLMDAATWLMLPPESSLAFVLADKGFDVWLANTRGTKFSQGHSSLGPDDPGFWDWSWDELVAFDLPATLQYVHDHTGQKMHYVGHSLGTLTALAAFSKHQLLDMLRSAALISPIAHLGKVTSPIARNAADNFLGEVLFWLGVKEFDPRGKAGIQLLVEVCAKPGVDCVNLLTSFTGQNCCLNPSVSQIFLTHEPQPTATKNMIHLSQMIRSGTISMYDYVDVIQNIKHYGQPTPPEYNMASIPTDFPLFLTYGGADALSDVNDVQLLLDNLKDHDGDKLVVQFREDYAHADFVMGENAKQAVYDPLIAFFNLQ
ncbi:triacylglycerol lipase 2 [Cucumis sativus]|uniref:triacylglycerol lipase 2 n=1 Tax=Cucumis sativus TaxID=3659 RepID=UPI0012F4FDD6|nr:triacylglycerol lipase 2 [Cucumis sativus]